VLPGIDRARERRLIEHARTLSAPLVYFELPLGHMITRRVKGRHPIPGERSSGDLEAVAALLGKIHALPIVASHYDPAATSRAYLEEARRSGAVIPRELERAAAESWHSMASCFCHNDFNPWNIVLGDTHCALDWEWAGMSDPFFDVAGVLVTHALEPREADAFLAHYLVADPDPDTREHLSHAIRLYWLREGSWALLQMARGNERGEIERQLADAVKFLSACV
jgi:thiamine kinase